ncbi:MAG: hypothetical protein ACOYLB_05085 [Phototrophicaceae bacterium]
MSSRETLIHSLTLLFHGRYGYTATPVPMNTITALRTITGADAEEIADLLTQDIIRGVFAESVFSQLLGSQYDLVATQLTVGDLEGAISTLTNLKMNVDQLAQLLTHQQAAPTLSIPTADATSVGYAKPIKYFVRNATPESIRQLLGESHFGLDENGQPVHQNDPHRNKRDRAYKQLVQIAQGDGALILPILVDSLRQGKVFEELFKIVGESATQALHELMNDPKEAPFVRERASQMVGEQDTLNIEDDIAKLVRQIFSAKGKTRELGIQHLATNQKEYCIPALLASLRSPEYDSSAKAEMLDLLVQIGHTDALTGLQDVLETLDDPQLIGMVAITRVKIAGDFARGLSGAVGQWGHINPELAYRVLAHFGDFADYDELMNIMLSPNEDLLRRQFAAAALGMSAEIDYVIPLLRYLNVNDQEERNRRWYKFIKYEAQNSEHRMTNLFGKRLRYEMSSAVTKLDENRQQLIQDLVDALVHFGNETAAMALNRLSSNPMLPADLRRKTAQALQNMYGK